MNSLNEVLLRLFTVEQFFVQNNDLLSAIPSGNLNSFACWHIFGSHEFVCQNPFVRYFCIET